MIAHPQLTLDLFGRLTILHNGQPVEVKSHKAEALLVYLALQRRPQGRDGLATLLWPEASQARARANLRRALWTLNQTPLASWVDGTTDFVALRTDDLTIDAVSFEELLAQHLADGAAILAAATPPDLASHASGLSDDFEHLLWFDLPTGALGS